MAEEGCEVAAPGKQGRRVDHVLAAPRRDGKHYQVCWGRVVSVCVVCGQQQREIQQPAGGIPSGSNPVLAAICITLSLIICHQGESQLVWPNPANQ
jgi:hypothetical protein